MRFLLDTNICSAHMRRPGRLAHRFIQHSGQLVISSVVLAELYAGAYKHPQPGRILGLISDILREIVVVDFDSQTAEEFGKIRGGLLQRGIVVATADLMIAANTIQHGLTLVTHNTADYRHIPGLILDDWLIP
jgi:tRNA(fMet)-specific endonuclease VapC